jgi:hypothetical protein
MTGDCRADDARSEICPELLCDGPGTWHWNGDQCFWIDCGACEGADCDHSFSSEADCRAAHASCEPTLCRESGGAWMWWAEECGHYECGSPVPAICEMGFPICDCGAFRRFEAGVGCVMATDCPIPEPVTREELCRGTGGSWEPICCDTECGVRCDLECLAPACNCGPGRVFEDARGCIDHPRCHERDEGETCLGEARCESGTICCMHCGGAGCFGDPTCDRPVCDADPVIDECGNNTMAP